MNKRIQIEVVEGDAVMFRADVLALKYAQARYGVDETVADLLRLAGLRGSEITAPLDEYRFVSSRGCLNADHVLIVGVETLYEFGYREIREFGRRVLASSANEAPTIRHIAATIHGVGYGLDEIEAFESQIAGFMDAIVGSDIPRDLERISVVEHNPDRVERLQDVLTSLVPSGFVESTLATDFDPGEQILSLDRTSAKKAHVIVAMPKSLRIKRFDGVKVICGTPSNL